MNLDFKKVVSECEKRMINEAMFLAKDNKTEAAKKLGIKRTTLVMKLKRIDDDQKVTEVVPG